MTTTVAMVRGKSALLERLLEVRAATERLAAPLSAEDQMLQSMPDASPVKWHQAHTTWFFETFVLRPHLSGYEAFHDDFIRVFNSYYKQVGEHPNRARRGLFSRPSLADVQAYRSYVNEHLERLLERGVMPHVEELIVLGMNHEQQHQELILTDIKHALWSQPLQPAYAVDAPHPVRSGHKREWVEFAGGVRSIGFAGGGFCFDNELPRHEVLLQPFRLASRLVTCGEYLDFIGAGGYREPNLWLSEGWDTVCREAWDAPLYWRERDETWQEFTLSGWQAIDNDAPMCHVSYFEADAYARWRSSRLPTEAEWEVAAQGLPITGNFADSKKGESGGRGLNQMYGDVWEWTQSSYAAYPGFKSAPGAIGEYNGKFMCNQYVLRGGSCATPQSHVRASYRNFFPAHVRWQFSGIRLAAEIA